jgi:hypothetical protein
MSLFVRPNRAVARRVGLFVLVVLAVSYGSNIVSAIRLEFVLARRISRDVLHSRTFFVLPSAQDESEADNSLSQRVALRLFRFAGGDAIPYHGPIDHTFAGFPWAELMRPDISIPFVVVVEWGYAYEPLAGQGFKSRVVAVFGVILHESILETWVS